MHDVDRTATIKSELTISTSNNHGNDYIRRKKTIHRDQTCNTTIDCN